MAKQKFKIGDKVTPKKGYYAGKPGIITHSFTHDSRKRYCVIFDNNKYETHCFWSYELLFADLHALAEHYKKEDTVCGPYGYIPNFNKEEEKLNNNAIKFPSIDTPLFCIGDIVKVIMSKEVPNLGIITKILDNKKYRYEVGFPNGKTEIYFDYQLTKAVPNDESFYYEFMELAKMAEGIGPKEVKKCKLCGTSFDEIEESKEEPGTCEYCIEQRNLISDVNMRKAANVDLGKFSIFGHEGDWLEVTEWTNGEGIDISIHYASDHDETNRDFMLSYDELSAIMNIVNKFGTLPAVFTKKPKMINKINEE